MRHVREGLAHRLALGSDTHNVCVRPARHENPLQAEDGLLEYGRYYNVNARSGPTVTL